MNYFEHHIGDYDQATAHLSAVEDGIYSRMIRWYMADEKPLPADVFAITRRVRAHSRDEKAAVKTILAEFFELREDGHHQARCDAEIARFQDKQRKAQASANARWSKSERNANASGTHDADDMRTHSEGNAPRARPQTPDTKHQTPSTSEAVPDGTGAGAPPAPVDVIFGRGVPLFTAAGVSDRNARSMLGLMRKTHGDAAVIDAVQRCAEERPLEPVAWLQAALKAAGAKPAPRRGSPSQAELDEINARNNEETRRLLFGDTQETIDG